MITVTIEGMPREFSSRSDVDEAWINEQLDRRRRATGQAPCVRVHVVLGPMNVSLATASCGAESGGYRRPTGREQEVLDLWQTIALADRPLVGGRLVEFLKRVFSMAG